MLNVKLIISLKATFGSFQIQINFNFIFDLVNGIFGFSLDRKFVEI